MARNKLASAGPTIHDIALHLGVHKSTVSRAMDPARRHLIGPALLRKVEAASRELGWRPNRAAAALSTGRSRTVGVLLPDITNPVFPPILRGIEDALDAEGYFALLANTARHDGGVAAAQMAVERMQAQRVEGFLVATALRDDAWLDGLRRAGARIVLVNRTNDGGHAAGSEAGRGQLPAVISDDGLGMRLAVDHLVRLGHTRIAHLAGPAGYSTGQARRVGFEQALRAHRLKPAGIVDCAAYSIAAGDAAMAQLLAARPRGRSAAAAGAAAGAQGLPDFTAVVAANDLIALGALQVLQGAGLNVPQQVSLIGHNDMPLLAQLSPPLTSVRIQHYEMGYRAARLLLEALRDVPGTASTVVLRPELVVRGSTAVVRTG